MQGQLTTQWGARGARGARGIETIETHRPESLWRSQSGISIRRGPPVIARRRPPSSIRGPR